MFLLVSFSPTPPLSAGAGLGNQVRSVEAQDMLAEFSGRVWGSSCVCRPAYTPRSVPGCSLGNRATQLRHSTVGFSCYFLFRLAVPPPLGAGGDLGILATLTVAQDCLTSCSLFRCYNFASPALAKVVALLRFSAYPSTNSCPAPPFK